MTSKFIRCRILLFLFLLPLLSACNSFLSASGPATRDISGVISEQRTDGIQIVDVTDSVARRLTAKKSYQLFSDMFPTPLNSSITVGAGDVLEVSLWEAPPAALFGTSAIDLRSGGATARIASFPEQMISSEGTITIPFIGPVQAAGRTLQQIESAIVKGLQGKANDPQVTVRLTRNTTSNVTLVGEVGASTLMPLTPKGERLLDALASAHGVKQPVNKITLQVTRGDKVQSMPLETIIRDPRQNIRLQPGDVITALYQPLSFTVLGATGKNEEVNFEAQGISLAQALARSGGLQDARADARGVFIFRFEEADAQEWPFKPVVTTPENRVPVVYRVNLRDPASFLVAQNFPVYNKDLLYVSNAPAAELQKFLNILMSTIVPIATVNSLTR